MVNLLVRVLVNAVALWVASALVEGIRVEETDTGERVQTLLLVAVVFGLVNAVIRPVVRFFTFPLFVLTLGLITFVVNALMLMLTAWIAQRSALDFFVDGFGAALLGAVVVAVVSWVLSLLLPD